MCVHDEGGSSCIPSESFHVQYSAASMVFEATPMRQALLLNKCYSCAIIMFSRL